MKLRFTNLLSGRAMICTHPGHFSKSKEIIFPIFKLRKVFNILPVIAEY